VSDNRYPECHVKNGDAHLEHCSELLRQTKKAPAEGDLDSNERGTCARFNSGKPSFSLVPLHLLAGAARVLMYYSVEKYAPWNWAKGGKWTTPMDCLLRHLFKWWFMGEECDEESGFHHLDHAMCNLLFLIHYAHTYKEGDNRPPMDSTAFDLFMEEFNKRLVIEQEDEQKEAA
jgi:hypothetical protein